MPGTFWSSKDKESNKIKSLSSWIKYVNKIFTKKYFKVIGTKKVNQAGWGHGTALGIWGCYSRWPCNEVTLQLQSGWNEQDSHDDTGETMFQAEGTRSTEALKQDRFRMFKISKEANGKGAKIILGKNNTRCNQNGDQHQIMQSLVGHGEPLNCWLCVTGNLWEILNTELMSLKLHSKRLTLIAMWKWLLVLGESKCKDIG